MKYLMTIAYNGANYAGWQRQNNAMTVQQRVEEAITSLYKKEITIIGASRTDAGVHALGQRAVFAVEAGNIPTDKLPYAINSQLPEDIAVTAAEIVSEDFHPQYQAVNKTYRYRIYNSLFRNPLVNGFSWHVYNKLNLQDMKTAASQFIGRHDFTSFCASGGSAKTTIRQIHSTNVFDDEGCICFDVNGNGFLYNMVRIMAGTLVYIGYGKLAPDSVENIIEAKDRTKAGITAPPQGLCLMDIHY